MRFLLGRTRRPQRSRRRPSRIMEKPLDNTNPTDASPQVDGVEAALIASVRSDAVVTAVGTSALGGKPPEDDSGRKSEEIEAMADETIERLAREAADEAPTPRAAQLQYEWRKAELTEERDWLRRDRELVAARRARG